MSQYDGPDVIVRAVVVSGVRPFWDLCPWVRPGWAGRDRAMRRDVSRSRPRSFHVKHPIRSGASRRAVSSRCSPDVSGLGQGRGPRAGHSGVLYAGVFVLAQAALLDGLQVGVDDGKVAVGRDVHSEERRRARPVARGTGFFQRGLDGGRCGQDSQRGVTTSLGSRDCPGPGPVGRRGDSVTDAEPVDVVRNAEDALTVFRNRFGPQGLQIDSRVAVVILKEADGYLLWPGSRVTHAGQWFRGADAGHATV